MSEFARAHRYTPLCGLLLERCCAASPYERARVRQALHLLEWDLAEYRSATFGVAVAEAAAEAAAAFKQTGAEGEAGAGASAGESAGSFVVAMPPPQQRAAKASLGARPDPAREAHPLDRVVSKAASVDSATGAHVDADDGALSSLWRLYVGAGRMLLRKYARENRLAIEHDFFDRAKRAAEASHAPSRSPSVASRASSARRSNGRSRGRRSGDATRAKRRRHSRAADDDNDSDNVDDEYDDDYDDEAAAASEQRQTIAAAALARLSDLDSAREAKLIRTGGIRAQRPSATATPSRNLASGPDGATAGARGQAESDHDDPDAAASWSDLSSAQRATLALQLFLLYVCVPLAALGALHSLLLPPLALAFAAACALSQSSAAFASFGCPAAGSSSFSGSGTHAWPLDALTTVVCAAHCAALLALLPLAWRALAFQRRAWPVRMFGVELEEGTADRLIAYHAALRHFEALRPLLENEGGLPADVAELVLRFMPAPEMDCVADLQYRMLLPVYAQAYAQAEEDDDGGDDDDDYDDQSQVSRRAPLSQSASGWSDSTFAD